MDLHDETVNYMMELKGKEMEDMDIWNQFQGYHGKKLSLLFCNSIYLRRRPLLYQCLEDQD